MFQPSETYDLYLRYAEGDHLLATLIILVVWFSPLVLAAWRLPYDRSWMFDAWCLAAIVGFVYVGTDLWGINSHFPWDTVFPQGTQL